MKKTLGAMAALALVMASPGATALAAEKEASVFVKCDGKPNSASTLGTIARLVALSAVVGLLLPPPEAADEEKREVGLAGIEACDAALTGENPASDGGRRIELLLARSIHHMETGEWDKAIADAQAAPLDQPQLAATRAYKQSLGLTAKNLEAMALVGKGDFPAARRVAIEMANQAPYDLRNMLFALDYMRLEEEPSEESERFFRQFVRIYPVGLIDRANYRARMRRFDEAAADYLARGEFFRSVPDWPGFVDDARGAVGLRLAGDAARADALIAEARRVSLTKKGASDMADLVSSVAELDDFDALIQKLEQGDVKLARTLFAARSRWDAVPDGYVTELSRRIDAASSPADRDAIPIPSAEKIRAEQVEGFVAVINDAGEKSRDRWRSFHLAFSDKDFAAFTANVWRTDKSKYIAKEPEAKWNASYITSSRNGMGMPSAYALYMHAALSARAQGKKGFLLLPGQRYVYAHFIRIGSPGDKDIFEPVLFDADEVIADLGPYFPQPVKR
jgi:hypothetical protein